MRFAWAVCEGREKCWGRAGGHVIASKPLKYVAATACSRCKVDYSPMAMLIGLVDYIKRRPLPIAPSLAIPTCQSRGPAPPCEATVQPAEPPRWNTHQTAQRLCMATDCFDPRPTGNKATGQRVPRSLLKRQSKRAGFRVLEWGEKSQAPC